MAKLAELKKYLNYEFSSGCYTGEDYKSFQTKYINYLKALCRDNHWQLVNVGRNHYCFSAFIQSSQADLCIFYYNKDYEPPLKPATRKQLFSYQPKSGTKVAYEYATLKKKKILNLFLL